MTNNLVLGILIMAVCLVIQCLVAGLLLKLLDWLEHRHRFTPTLFQLVRLLTLSMLVLLAGNLLQIAVWASLFCFVGEFTDFGTAFYHSTVNFTTLGYGDIVMSFERRILGALEAANGVMMFGLSTSVMLSVVNLALRKMRSQRNVS